LHEIKNEPNFRSGAGHPLIEIETYISTHHETSGRVRVHPRVKIFAPSGFRICGLNLLSLILLHKIFPKLFFCNIFWDSCTDLFFLCAVCLLVCLMRDVRRRVFHGPNPSRSNATYCFYQNYALIEDFFCCCLSCPCLTTNLGRKALITCLF
jgi:hypothetical protein